MNKSFLVLSAVLVAVIVNAADKGTSEFATIRKGGKISWRCDVSEKSVHSRVEGRQGVPFERYIYRFAK